jgi:hypothetical protein
MRRALVHSTALIVLCPALVMCGESEDRFEARIRPVLVETCLPCHGGQETNASTLAHLCSPVVTADPRSNRVIPSAVY